MSPVADHRPRTAAGSASALDRANVSIAMPKIVEEFHISHTLEGLALGAFFWTYALFQLPAGHLIDRFGARIMYTFAVVWWSVFTALTAVANSFGSLFGYRLGLGVGESAAYPANAKVVSMWFPRRERALATSIYDSGARFGSAAALPLVAFLVTPSDGAGPSSSRERSGSCGPSAGPSGTAIHASTAARPPRKSTTSRKEGPAARMPTKQPAPCGGVTFSATARSGG